MRWGSRTEPALRWLAALLLVLAALVGCETMGGREALRVNVAGVDPL